MPRVSFLFFLMLACILTLTQCSFGSRQNNPAFENPTFTFPSNMIKEPGEGYPFPVKEYPGQKPQKKSVEAMKEFAQKIKDRFEDSNMKEKEAQRLYRLLEKQYTITDESYGMPSPQLSSKKSVNYHDRVMIRKTGDQTYEMFYYYLGCGIHYDYMAIRMNDEKLSFKPIEKWTEYHPC